MKRLQRKTGSLWRSLFISQTSPLIIAGIAEGRKFVQMVDVPVIARSSGVGFVPLSLSKVVYSLARETRGFVRFVEDLGCSAKEL